MTADSGLGDRDSPKRAQVRYWRQPVGWSSGSSDASLCEKISGELAAGRLVFWFQPDGRGPAPGATGACWRTRVGDMWALINTKSSCSRFDHLHRRCWRSASRYFELVGLSPFMLRTAVQSSMKGVIPAVVHVDGTARVQTVDRDSNPRYRRLLEPPTPPAFRAC